MSGKRKQKLSVLVKQQHPALDTRQIEVRILSGEVLANGERITDKNRLVDAAALVTFREAKPYVSRGGEKLAPLLAAWEIPVQDKVWLDTGASTGGFTDCLLRHGARLVYAVDVGYNQLAYSLRGDARVVCLERTNPFDLAPTALVPRPEAAVCDLAFRSLAGIAGRILELVSGDLLLALVKPQFEAAQQPGFRGIVASGREVYRIAHELAGRLAAEGVYVQRAALSPLLGHKGNRELFFLLARKQGGELSAVLADCRAALID